MNDRKNEASRRLADAVRHFIAANPSLTEIVPSLASVRDALDDYDKCEEYE